MFGASRTPHRLERSNLIEDLLEKEHGREVKVKDIAWAPLNQILSSDKKNVTLAFKNKENVKIDNKN